MSGRQKPTGMTLGTSTNTSDAGSTSAKSSEISPEQEYFLYELETTEIGSIGLVLRAIYEPGRDVHKFMGALERKIHHYDKDIERLCNQHYSGFIETVRELVTVKQQCRMLREQIQSVDSHLDESSKSLISKGEELVRCRKMQKNIAAAIDSVSLCLPVLEKYNKLQEHMQKKQHFQALKTLEQLEGTYLNQSSGMPQYRFFNDLFSNIDAIRTKIKEASFSEATDFLENVRKKCATIGEVAFRHAVENMKKTSSRKSRRIRLTSPPPSDSPERVMSPTVNGAEAEEEEAPAQDMIDFGPIYRCYHIFSVLNDKEIFEKYYQKQRREQAVLAFRAPERMHGTLESYRNYFHEVIGFLVIEDHVMRTAAGLVTRAYRDELWDLALNQVKRTLNNHFGNCTDAKVMLKIKELILCFAITLKGYGFQVQPFYTLLQSFRDQYNEILMTECCTHFEEIMKTDNYTPITVETEVDYKSVTDRFPIYNRALEQEKFPKKFPFSDFVPSMYVEMREYIRGCLKFTEDLGLNQQDVEETLRKNTNMMLERISGTLKMFVLSTGKSKWGIVQLIQITINMGYLEKSCESLEQYIARLIYRDGAAQSSTHAVKLKQGAYMFTDARTEVEQMIYESLQAKISDFVELATYDWDLAESDGKPSGYIMDLISFLRSTFLSFTNLPVTLARAACMSACKHLAGCLMSFLVDPDVKQISMAALQQFSLDVVQCEMFAAQCPVPGLDGETVSLSFADLRQLLDLFLYWEWSSYLADYGNDRSKFPRVSPSVAMMLLEKVMENDRKKSSIFGRGKDKDKKKLADTVLKQLKLLCTTDGR